MKIRKLHMALCGALFAAQMASAQQNMFLLDNNGKVIVWGTTSGVLQVNYATFNSDKLFTINNVCIDSVKTNLITATCSVYLSAESNVRYLGTTPEVGVCYSKNNSVPTIDDDCLSLGSELKRYTFSLSKLTSGTTYYFRMYVKLAGSVLYGDVTNAKTLVPDNSKTINGHKFVDLGLPSGLLWAETNIGAEKPADTGNYYAWGETTPKDIYDWSNYNYGTPFNLTESTNRTLREKWDAAYVNWGSPCRMPTASEFARLCDTYYCTWTWTSMITSDGTSINGYKVTSVKNGNSIFLPASGYRSDGSLYKQGSCGYYWSSSLESSFSDLALDLCFTNTAYSRGQSEACYGYLVRPVAEP